MKRSKQEILEQNVISMAITNTNLEKLKDPNLTPDLFMLPVHQEIIKACKDTLKEKEEVSNMPYEDIFPKLSESAQTYFGQIMGTAFEHADYDNYLSQLGEQKAIRDIYELVNEAIQGNVTLDELKTKIAKIEELNSKIAFKQWTLDDLYNLPRKNEETLIFKHDRYMQYVRPKKHTVNVIGARTGVGKTTFALNLVNDLGESYRVLYFNLEMSEIEVIRRLLALQSGVEIDKIENNQMNTKENNRYVDACTRYEERLSANVSIIDGSKSIDSIRRIVAKEARKGHCIVFIDHIGYIKNKGFTNTRESVQHTMIELNNMTKDFDCTVFAISQLNRGAEGEQPQLKDLKDSGEVEQTAHSITLLYDETNNRASLISQYKLICAKNRGKLGTCDVRFNKANQRFIYQGGNQ